MGYSLELLNAIIFFVQCPISSVTSWARKSPDSDNELLLRYTIIHPTTLTTLSRNLYPSRGVTYQYLITISVGLPSKH